MSETQQRKLEHIKIVLENKVEPDFSVFDKYSLPYKALPEINLSDVDTSTNFFNKNLSFPFIISSMTGGAARAGLINKNLAMAAQEMKVALGLGSMRITIAEPSSLESFKIRNLCPDIPLFANVGIVQLNYGFGIDEIKRIVDSVEANGIFLHVNPLQEAVQPGGDTNFKGILEKLEKIINQIPVPVIIKEVGHGIDFHTAKRLFELGVKWIDVAGVGGTSWAQVEGYRGNQRLGDLFAQVGIATDEALKQNSKIQGLNLIAGGGIRSGVDIAKSIMLGAKMATSAKPFLAAALESPEKVIEVINQFKKELEIAMFAVGVENLSTLSKITLN